MKVTNKKQRQSNSNNYHNSSNKWTAIRIYNKKKKLEEIRQPIIILVILKWVLAIMLNHPRAI